MDTNTMEYGYYSSTKTLLFLVESCISLNMHMLQSLLKFKIFTIKIPKDSLSEPSLLKKCLLLK